MCESGLQKLERYGIQIEQLIMEPQRCLYSLETSSSFTCSSVSGMLTAGPVLSQDKAAKVLSLVNVSNAASS